MAKQVLREYKREEFVIMGYFLIAFSALIISLFISLVVFLLAAYFKMKSNQAGHSEMDFFDYIQNTSKRIFHTVFIILFVLINGVLMAFYSFGT